MSFGVLAQRNTAYLDHRALDVQFLPRAGLGGRVGVELVEPLVDNAHGLRPYEGVVCLRQAVLAGPRRNVAWSNRDTYLAEGGFGYAAMPLPLCALCSNKIFSVNIEDLVLERSISDTLPFIEGRHTATTSFVNVCLSEVICLIASASANQK